MCSEQRDTAGLQWVTHMEGWHYVAGETVKHALKQRAEAPPLLLCCVQKCHLQCGVPLEQSARLAAHTVDECKKYAANANYELSDATATPLKLVSRRVSEWASEGASEGPSE